jgi:hypothetical protein
LRHLRIFVKLDKFQKIKNMDKITIKGISHNLDLLLSTFNIELVNESSFLTEWLTVKSNLSDSDAIIVEKLYNQAKLEANHWNEEELKMRLVSVLFLLSDIDVPKKVKVFYERPMKGIIDNVEVAIVADCLVASPLAINTPQKPLCKTYPNLDSVVFASCFNMLPKLTLSVGVNTPQADTV